jgi:NAD(P)-dependent dehydrogenase (short-subunit alcohol dehydrogenase family)
MNTHAHVALITGASRGLGLEIARAYARRGLHLVLTARGAAELNTIAAELACTTGVVALPGDVADPTHLERLFTTAIETFGRVDVLINNASELGPSPLVPLEELRAEQFEQILRVNVTAPLRLMQLVLPAMRERHNGLIVNVTSDAAVNAYPTWGGYGSSKAALEHLSRIVAAELEGTGVRVYVVDPGDMNTEMHQAAEPGVDLAHLPGPEQIAPAFVRLLDEPAAAGRFEAANLLPAAVG